MGAAPARKAENVRESLGAMPTLKVGMVRRVSIKKTNV
jgi:hypothetical protein